MTQIFSVSSSFTALAHGRKAKNLRHLRNLRALYYQRDFNYQRAQILDFILREMTHDVSASETQHQYDDGEYHSCSIGSVLHILLRRA